MIVETVNGDTIDGAVVNNYFRLLVNLFFKILPIWESGDGSVKVYMENLQSEMLGCKNVIAAINNDGLFLSLISMLQDLIDHPGYDHAKVRRTVFNAITVCNKLNSRYAVEVRNERLG